MSQEHHEVIIVGGGPAGLSAAVYLGRALRDTLLISSGRSMAEWEPQVQNYLGFPEGISGAELVRLGRIQAERYGVRFAEDEITKAGCCTSGSFSLQGAQTEYLAERLLLATGIYHLPPEIEGVRDCIGHSLFFCKDCDGHRVQGKHVAIYGWNNEAVEYALGMMVYTASVIILTDHHPPSWDQKHQRWLEEYEIPVYTDPVRKLEYQSGIITSVVLAEGTTVGVEVVFTTRGDIYFNELAQGLGAEIGAEGEIQTDAEQRTTVPGLYAAGCVTPANCQLIIAAGAGAAAAQAINRDLLKQSLLSHSLRRYRLQQLKNEKTEPPRGLSRESAR